jgi:hypothetical protein
LQTRAAICKQGEITELGTTEITAAAKPPEGDILRADRHPSADPIPWIDQYKQVIVTYTPVGFISLGGPPATDAIMHKNILVVRNRWFDEGLFAELFAIRQGLLGPLVVQRVISTKIAWRT